MELSRIEKSNNNWGLAGMLRKYPFLKVERNEAPIIFAQPQPQTSQAQPTQQNFAPKFLEMTQPMPEMDTEGVQAQQKRARQAVLGSLLGAAGQLGGMATGGDAIALPNNVPQIALNQILTLEKDYRDRLGQYWKDALSTDRFNTEAINQFRGQEANRAFTEGQQARQFEFQEGQQARQFEFQEGQQGRQFEFQEGQQSRTQAFQAEQARERDKAQMKLLQARNYNEYADKLRSVGVNPNTKDALDQYLAKMDQQYQTNLDRTASTANYNNRRTGGSGKAYDVTDPDFIAKVRIGRDLEVNRLRQELNQQLTVPDFANKEGQKQRIADIREKLKRLETLKVEPGNQEAVDLYEMALEIENSGGVDYSQSPPQQGQFVPPPPPQGGGQTRQNVQQEFNQVMSEVIAGNFNNLQTAINILVEQGRAKDDDEAYQIIKNYRDQYLKNQKQ